MQFRRIQTLPSPPTPLPPSFNENSPPRPHVTLNPTTTRRMLKRAHLAKKNPDDDPILAVHEEVSAQEANLASAAPFTETASPKSTSTGYSVQCYATHTEDEQKRKDIEAAEKEMQVLLRSVNASRQFEGAPPLKLHPLLSKAAQDQADGLYLDECSCPPTSGGLYVPNVTVHHSRSGRRRATLISPPGLGALACGEMWFSGKYRRHLYAVRAREDVEGGGSVHHPEDCPCHLRIVFETMVDEGWSFVGIGRGGGGRGRWVVELGE